MMVEITLSMLTFATLANALKYETLGMTLGIAGGGLTELLANEVCDALELHDPSNHSSVDKQVPALVAEMIVRGAIGCVGYLLTERMVRMVNAQRDDPTEGAYFAYAFGVSQGKLFDVTRNIGRLISSGKIFGFGAGASACCDGCASGTGCADKH